MLTAIACLAAKPAEKPYKLGDAGGLYLYVRPSGTKTWQLKYYFHRKQKKLTIGPFPEVSLSEAREARDEARRMLRQDIDPALERKRLRAEASAAAETTFRSVALEWHAIREERWNRRYAGQIRSRLDNHLFGVIGSTPIAKVTPAMMLEALRVIERSGAFEMAHRVRQHASDVFVHAIATGRAESDPAHIVRKALKPVPKRLWPAATKLEDARAVLVSVEMQSTDRVFKLASRLLALTAARSGVLRLAEPREFEGLNTNAPIWRIPAEKMKLTLERKADASFEFVIPLSSWATKVVAAAIEITGPNARYLFPSVRDPKKPIAHTSLGELYRNAGMRGRHVPHGWRASFSTIMNEHVAQHGRDEDRAIIDLMLAHVPKGVEAAYNRAVYMPRRRELAQSWGDMLMEGAAPVDSLLGR